MNGIVKRKNTHCNNITSGEMKTMNYYIASINEWKGSKGKIIRRNKEDEEEKEWQQEQEQE